MLLGERFISKKMIKLFCILLLTGAIVAFRQSARTIRFEDLDFQIYSVNYGNFEEDVNNRISEATKFASDLALTAKGLSMVPFLEDIGKPFSGVMDAFKNAAWKTALVQAISEETHRVVLQQAYSEMNAKMITVSQDFVTLRNLGHSASAGERSNKVQNMYDKLSDVNNIFIQRDSLFRQYPRFAYMPLAALTSIVMLLHPVYVEFAPTFAQHSFLACLLLDNLREYQFLLIASRFSDMRIKVKQEVGPSVTRLPEWRRQVFADVLNRDYEPYGYNRTNDGTIKCEEIGCKILDKSGNDLCLYDTQGKFNIFIGHPSQYVEDGFDRVKNCAMGYAEFVRGRIEKAFQPHIELATQVCNEMRHRRKPTGRGWLTLNIIGIGGKKKLNSRKACDTFLGTTKYNDCDPYAVLYINGMKVVQTEDALDMDENYVMHMYQSEKISKDSTYQIEIWYSDTGDDEICLRQRGNVRDLTDRSVLIQDSNSNWLQMKSIWRDYYEDDKDI